MNYLGQSGRMETFGSGAALIRGGTISLTNGSSVPAGESIAVIFQTPAHMLGRDLAIMWWDEARGTWREINATVTPDGSIIGVTNFTGTFVLVMKD